MERGLKPATTFQGDACRRGIQPAFQFSPADRLTFDLLVEPSIQRLEIIENGGRVHLPGTGYLVERLRPRTRETHRKHCIEPLAGLGTLINRAAMNRQRAARGLRKRAMKLELKNEGKKVTRIRHV